MESTIKCGKHLALHAKLTGSRFEDVCLGDAEFDNVSLAQARFRNVNLSEIVVSHFQMGGAKFIYGGLHPKRDQRPIAFEKCELVATTFKDCDLSNAELSGCSLSGMKIDGVLVTDLIAAYKAKR